MTLQYSKGVCVFLFPSTLNAPVYEEGSGLVPDVVEPSVLSVLQDTHEQECPQPAAGSAFPAGCSS